MFVLEKYSIGKGKFWGQKNASNNVPCSLQYNCFKNPGNGKQFKCYTAIHHTGIKSYHFSDLRRAVCFSMALCHMVIYLPAEITLRWYNTQFCFGFFLKADTITTTIVTDYVVLCSTARDSLQFCNYLKWVIHAGFLCALLSFLIMLSKGNAGTVI